LTTDRHREQKWIRADTLRSNSNCRRVWHLARAASVVTISFVAAACTSSVNSAEKQTPMSNSTPRTSVVHEQQSPWVTTPVSTLQEKPPLLSQNGAGNGTTRAFTIQTAPWTVDWNFDCYKSEGSFSFSVEGLAGAASTTDAGASKTGVTDGGVTTYQDTGTFQLAITTPCSWSIQVIAPS